MKGFIIFSVCIFLFGACVGHLTASARYHAQIATVDIQKDMKAEAVRGLDSCADLLAQCRVHATACTIPLSGQ